MSYNSTAETTMVKVTVEDTTLVISEWIHQQMVGCIVSVTI